MALSNGYILYAYILSGDVNYALTLSATFTCIENNIVRRVTPTYNGQYAIIIVRHCPCCLEIILLTLFLSYMWMWLEGVRDICVFHTD